MRVSPFALRAVIHDVCEPMGFFSFSYKVLSPFSSAFRARGDLDPSMTVHSCL